jgi:O-antigen ligase
MAGWLGLILVAGTLIAVRSRLEVLLRRTVALVAAMGALGLMQFWTGQAFTEYLKLPGLTANLRVSSVIGRDGFNRPAGTAVHPIEFGVVLTMLLPIALHYALTDEDRPALRRWLPVVIIGLAIPASVSRSSILCSVVVLAFLFPSWTARIRLYACGAIVALTGVVFVGMPGMLGTLLKLFSGINQDSSALSRTDSYTTAWEFIVRTPVFGRGFATFLPVYRILDNQYLGSLIELGFVGVGSLIALFLTGVVTGIRVRKRSTDPVTRSLALSLAASLAAGMTSFAFFDAFSFSMISGLMFFTLGMINALHRLYTAQGMQIATDIARQSSSPMTGAFVIAALELEATDLDLEPAQSSIARHAGQGITRHKRKGPAPTSPPPAAPALPPQDGPSERS